MVLGRNRCGNTAMILHFFQNDKRSENDRLLNKKNGEAGI